MGWKMKPIASIYEKSALWYKDKVKKVYGKFLKREFEAVEYNRSVVFNCVNCGRKVETFIGTACGMTLLCPKCFKLKMEEFKQGYRKRVLFENLDKDLRDIWIAYFKDLVNPQNEI
jgi:ribosomal protein L37AE/L43A